MSDRVDIEALKALWAAAEIRIECAHLVCEPGNGAPCENCEENGQNDHLLHLAAREALPELLVMAERCELLVCRLRDAVGRRSLEVDHESAREAIVGFAARLLGGLGCGLRVHPCRHEEDLAYERMRLEDVQAEKPGAAEAVRLRRGIEEMLANIRQGGPDLVGAWMLRLLLDGDA